MNREQVLPEPKRFRRESTRLVVSGRDLGLVVVHNDNDLDQLLAGCRCDGAGLPEEDDKSGISEIDRRASFRTPRVHRAIAGSGRVGSPDR